MDDERSRFQELLNQEIQSDDTGDTFTKLCRFFGGGGCTEFWIAVRAHDYDYAALLCNDDPIVPQRTRNWLNGDAVQPYLPSLY